MSETAGRWRHRVVLLSPVVVMGAGAAVQHVAGHVFGVWAWVPTMLVFWAIVAGLIGWGRRGRPLKAWLARPRGRAVWSALAVLVGLLSLPEFLSGWRVLESPGVFFLWIGFGLVNPWFEEGYWRGLLIDATGGRRGLGVAYSAAAFAVSHPLIWGVHSTALRHPAVLVGLGVAGGVWGLAYWRSGSLRWAIVGHTLANLLGLSVPVLLNLHVPAGLR